ncbi:MAG TPA: glycosyl transferase, partial [Burkholderiaceae bacterium]|nr:glycosyl transferase [Burkholderiaceae bacterium]
MNDALAANAAEWHRARRVIAVRLDNLGDVLMTTPALAAIKETLPRSHLTLLASPSGSALAPYLPFINDVIAVRAPWVKHAFPPTDSEVHRTAAVITEGQFDAAVIFTTYTQSALPAALLLMLAGIPLR